MKYYLEYVNHILRFYSRYPTPPCFTCTADQKNWLSAKEVLDTLPESDRCVIIEVYQSRDTISGGVKQASRKYNISEGAIWTMLSNVTKRIAEKRELI